MNYLNDLLPELKMLILKYVIYYKWSIVEAINNKKAITNDKNIKDFRLKTICDIVKPENITYKTYKNDNIYYNNIKLTDKELKTIIKKYLFTDIIEYFYTPVWVFTDIPNWYNEDLYFTFKFKNNIIKTTINRLDYYRYKNIILISYYYKLIDKKLTYKGYKYNMDNTNATIGIFEIIYY